jgi:hypothetical protein
MKEMSLYPADVRRTRTISLSESQLNSRQQSARTFGKLPLGEPITKVGEKGRVPSLNTIMVPAFWSRVPWWLAMAAMSRTRPAEDQGIHWCSG